MKVFISHSSHDKWVAKQISAQLNEKGHDSFLDEKDISTGDSIDSEIQKHLKDSDELLLVLSPQSISSHWVYIEMGGAKALGKKVIPILLHVLPNDIPAPISELLARDINDIEKYFVELESRSSGKPAPKKKKAPIKKKVAGFSIGDKIKLAEVENLTEADKNTSPRWRDEMDKYSGVAAIITNIGDLNVRLSVDEDEFWWSPRWFTKID